jgi:hypothetical protein
VTKRVGITGHQHLADSDTWLWVEAALNSALEKFEGGLVGVSSLAAGTDQVFASLILRRGGQIHAVIPFADYERVFDADHLSAYRELFAKAHAVEVLRAANTVEGAYLAAGRRVVELADQMIAVWDGKPAKGMGGTAEVVAFAIERRVPLTHINPEDRTICQR